MSKKYIIVVVLFFMLFLCLQESSCAFVKKEKVAITAAMDCEMCYIAENMKKTKHEKFADTEILRGTLGKYNVILSKSGIGKVKAAIVTQFISDKYNPDYIINTGLAGGLEKGLKKGDIIIGDKLIQHDFDISVFGYAKGYIGNGINSDKPTVFVSDKKLTEIFKKAVPDAKTGIIVSGDVFVSDKNKKRELQKEFNASAVDMESAAIVQCANLNNIPVIIIRMISDSDEDDAQDYDKDEEKYAQKSAKFLVELLNK